MITLLDKVRSTIERYGLFSRGDRVVVAASGGPDSTAMLLALATLAPEYELSLTVAHLNHMFRGAEAEADAQWVADLAQRLGVAFVREDADVPALIARTGMTVEQAGRVARYRFYARLARETGATKVAVGQTQDDQAETVLLHLVRGAGLTGIAGIRPKRLAAYGWVVRPLLEVTRTETEAYCAAAGLVPRHDPYNDDESYLRNRIRYQLLPWLKANANPRIKETLAQAAAIWREEEDYLVAATEAAYRESVKEEDQGLAIDVAQLLALPLALRRRLVRQAFGRLLGGDVSNLGFEHTEAVLALGEAAVGKSLDLPRGVTAERLYTAVRLTLRHTREEVPAFCYRLSVPGTTIVPELGYAVSIWFEEGPGVQPTGSLVARAVFNYNEAGSVLYARNRRRGDWFRPRGGGGKKKLSDFLIDQKIPRSGRDRILLITTSKDIVWVVGLREDERFALTSGTQEKVFIEVRELAAAVKERGY